MTAEAAIHKTIAFGLRDGRMYEPREVESGLACGCVCPGCGAELVAKKGKRNAWHFAHHKVIATQSCAESAIHAAAKQVLIEKRELMAPEKRISVTGVTKHGISSTLSKVLKEARTIRFDCCLEEVWETNLRPDVVGYRGERRLWVEMYFTHKVDEEKRRKLVDQQIPAIEIDLSNLAVDAGFEEVRKRVLQDVAKKEWLFYPNTSEAEVALAVVLARQITDMESAHERLIAAQAERGEKEQHRIEEDNRRKAAEREIAESERKIRVEGYLRYKNTPLAEKERLLRQSLGINGKWPYYLSVVSPEANAIREPARIWQSALFEKFIFGNRNRHAEVGVGAIFEWLEGCFTIEPGRIVDVLGVLKRYLGYLQKCGFVQKSRRHAEPYAYIKVLHVELDLPSKLPDEMAALRLKFSDKSKDATAPSDTTVSYWHWQARWPSNSDIVARANVLEVATEHRQGLQVLLERLLRGSPSEPMKSAVALESQWGVPLGVTFDFLERLGLAWLSTRPVRAGK